MQNIITITIKHISGTSKEELKDQLTTAIPEFFQNDDAVGFLGFYSKNSLDTETISNLRFNVEYSSPEDRDKYEDIDLKEKDAVKIEPVNVLDAPLMHIAIHAFAIQILECLINNIHFPVNLLDSEKRNPLHYAVYRYACLPGREGSIHYRHHLYHGMGRNCCLLMAEILLVAGVDRKTQSNFGSAAKISVRATHDNLKIIHVEMLFTLLFNDAFREDENLIEELMHSLGCRDHHGMYYVNPENARLLSDVIKFIIDNKNICENLLTDIFKCMIHLVNNDNVSPLFYTKINDIIYEGSSKKSFPDFLPIGILKCFPILFEIKDVQHVINLSLHHMDLFTFLLDTDTEFVKERETGNPIIEVMLDIAKAQFDAACQKHDEFLSKFDDVCKKHYESLSKDGTTSLEAQLQKNGNIISLGLLAAKQIFKCPKNFVQFHKYVFNHFLHFAKKDCLLDNKKCKTIEYEVPGHDRLIISFVEPIDKPDRIVSFFVEYSLIILELRWNEKILNLIKDALTKSRMNTCRLSNLTDLGEINCSTPESQDSTNLLRSSENEPLLDEVGTLFPNPVLQRSDSMNSVGHLQAI